MVFNTKVSNKNPIHVFKYKRCKTCPIEINVKSKLIKYFVYLFEQFHVLKGVGKKMYWKQKYYNKFLVNASKNISIIIYSFIS
jgi:hypothetical protein